MHVFPHHSIVEILSIKGDYLYFDGGKKKIAISKIDWKSAIEIIKSNNSAEQELELLSDRTDRGCASFDLEIYDYSIHLNWSETMPAGLQKLIDFFYSYSK